MMRHGLNYKNLIPAQAGIHAFALSLKKVDPRLRGDEENNNRINGEAGIAIGMILFVIAILATLAIAISAGGSTGAGSTISADRVANDTKSQAFLIRSKILSCFTYGYERGDLADKYPDGASPGVLVENLTCPSYPDGLTSLWSGQEPAQLPPPTPGFDKWVYVNAGATGGRCIRIQPSTGNAANTGYKNGLVQASATFSSTELVYNPASADQRFIIWITQPSGTASTDCTTQ